MTMSLFYKEGMSLEVQWTDTDPTTGERRFVSAAKFAGRWQFKVRHKRREDWSMPATLTRAMWEELLDGLERRLPRREGATEEDVAAVKKILNEWRAD
jgi:hypothetical protein